MKNLTTSPVAAYIDLMVQGRQYTACTLYGRRRVGPGSGPDTTASLTNSWCVHCGHCQGHFTRSYVSWLWFPDALWGELSTTVL